MDKNNLQVNYNKKYVKMFSSEERKGKAGKGKEKLWGKERKRKGRDEEEERKSWGRGKEKNCSS